MIYPEFCIDIDDKWFYTLSTETIAKRMKSNPDSVVKVSMLLEGWSFEQIQALEKAAIEILNQGKDEQT